MAIIKFNKGNLVPNRAIIKEGIKIAVITTLVLFLLNFFGFVKFFNWIPEGFRLLALVFTSVYLSNILKVDL